MIQAIQSFEKYGYFIGELAKAIELNSPHSLMVVVDVDAKEEIELFTVAGFCKMEGQNSIAASYRLETV